MVSSRYFYEACNPRNVEDKNMQVKISRDFFVNTENIRSTLIHNKIAVTAAYITFH